MSHYARVENDIVVQVIVAEQEFIDTIEGEWVQTSYNTQAGVHTLGGTPLRKNYAGIGMIYDRKRDAFRYEQPYNSWILNEDSCIWEAPIPYPNDGNIYFWDEDNKEWILYIVTSD